MTIDKVKNSLSVFLKNCIKRKIEDRSIPLEQSVLLIKAISEIVFTVELDNNSLLNFGNSLQSLLNYNLIFENSEVVENLISLFEGTCENLTSEKILKNLISTLDSIVMSSSINQMNADKTFKRIFNLVQKILVYVCSKISANSTEIKFYESGEYLI